MVETAPESPAGRSNAEHVDTVLGDALESSVARIAEHVDPLANPAGADWSLPQPPPPPGKKDGEWVTVGGMIAECKRIRTKKGDPMMFATLDDLEGQVELLVFNSAFEANADKVDLDKLVIVRGRVDQKEAGETKLVAQELFLQCRLEPQSERHGCAADHRDERAFFDRCRQHSANQARVDRVSHELI